MNISPIASQNVRQNNTKSNNNPSFKKFCGIDDSYYSEYNSDELKVLLEEAKNFTDTKYCDVKYVKCPNSMYIVAVKLNEGHLTKIMTFKDNNTVVDAKTLGWRPVGYAFSENYSPATLTFCDNSNKDYDGKNTTLYAIEEIDEHTKSVYKNHKQRLENKFSRYPKLQYNSPLLEGLAYAYAFEAYCTRQKNEKSGKENLKNDFDKIINK